MFLFLILLSHHYNGASSLHFLNGMSTHIHEVPQYLKYVWQETLFKYINFWICQFLLFQILCPMYRVKKGVELLKEQKSQPPPQCTYIMAISWKDQEKTDTINSSNCRRYQARMVYSTRLQSFKNSALSEFCSAENSKNSGRWREITMGETGESCWYIICWFI